MRKLFFHLRRPFGGGALGAALAAAAMLVCRQSSAQIFITNNTAFSSLQNALVSGNTNIYLQFSGTMNPTGVLEIVENTVIDGTGFSPVIGGTSNQAFYVDPGVTFTLINVTLSGAFNGGTPGTAGVNGGNGSGNASGGDGSAGGNGTNALGGAVYNAGTSTFISCLFFTNAAVGGVGGAGGNGGNAGSLNGLSHGGNGGGGGTGGGGFGGAIYNDNGGTVVLSNCTIAGNDAFGGAGGAGGTNGTGSFASYAGAGAAGGAGSGAGIYNLGVVKLINTTINQNAGAGGAASQSSGGVPNTQTGTGATGVTGALSEGGGVFNLGTNSFLNCTFFANGVTGGLGGAGGPGNTNDFGKGGTGGNGGNAIGGGIYNGPGGIVSVTNCTFSGDVVTGGTNGAVGAGNVAGTSGSPGSALGANIANGNTGATFLFRNSILDFPTNATSASGTITDQGNNLSSDATPTFTTTNSFNSKDPKLSPSGLQGNGTTEVLTIALSANSPAINAIYDGSAPLYDERGFVRPGQVRPDIGAYEFGSSFSNYNVSGTVMSGTNVFPGVTVFVGNVSTVTASNGVFQFSLLSSNSYFVHPTNQAYFSPNSIMVVTSNNISGLVFTATNPAGSITNIVSTNVSGTNTNTLNLVFTGVPGLNYIVQAATNVAPSPVVWTNLATNNSGSSGKITFSYTLTGTNFTNFPKRYFRAIP